MSEQTSQEPTMEEILASIRRIISEDDAPAADAKATPPAGDEPPTPVEPEAAAPAPEPEPEPAPAAPEPAPEAVAAAPEPPAEEDDEALELTDKVETHGDLDVYTPPAPEPAPEPVAAAPAPEPREALVSATASAAAASAFERLSATIAMPAHGRTLEDVVRELLKPMLQQWLDDNLPGIVQQAVETEVERIARSVR